MTTDLRRPESLETVELTPALEGATRTPTGIDGDDDGTWRITKVRVNALLVVICAMCAVVGIVGVRSLRSESRPATPVCSTIRTGPTSCVTIDGSSVIGTLRNEKNVEVCGDFRLELLRYDRYDRRLVDSYQPSRKGCLPANDRWEFYFPLRLPGIRNASGALRPYRYMCVTGYRLSYGRWLETGWACQESNRASVKG